MRIKIDKSKLNELDYVKGKPMIDAWKTVRLVLITDYKYEIVKVPKTTVTGLFRKKTKVEEVEEVWLTEITLASWNNTAKFWGLHEDESRIDNFINLNDLIKLRRNFVELIMDPIRELGYDVTKKPKATKE